MQVPQQAVRGFCTQYRTIIYNINPSTVITEGFLAPIANPTLPAFNVYRTGMLLGQYTTANAPSPDLVGHYINYSDASANLDQKNPVAILIESNTTTNTTPIAEGLTGGLGGRYSIVMLLPNLVISGTNLALANASADITALKTIFSFYEPPLGSESYAYLDGEPDQVLILQKRI